MHLLIIEDEKPAAKQLLRLLERELDSFTVSGPLATISESKAWLANNPAPDLIFLDIHLADGPSFEIFRDQQALSAPIIFCTAYNQYALEAFKLNSLDYLLKPVEPEELHRALKKFEAQKPAPNLSQSLLLELLEKPRNAFKKRFVIKVGDKLQPIETEQIHFFFSESKATFLQHENGRQYPLEQSLDKLEPVLNPKQFFRISRKYLVSYAAIDEVRSYSSSRLKLTLKNCPDTDVLVSRDRTGDFKRWLDD
jgi:DNA-binding LytR/AlgR family response regulator